MSGSAQINSVIAGRVLWADFGDVRERVAPSENATANLSVPTASVARDRANAAIGGAGGCSVRGPGGPSYSVGRIGPSYFFGGTGTGDLVLRGTNIGDTGSGYVVYAANVLADEFAKCVGTATIYQLPHHGSLTAGLESAAATDVPFAIESALVTCSELLRARRGLLQHEQFEALGRQLDALLSDEDELVPEGIVVSVVSLDGLIGFLARHRWAGQHPNIAITRDGRFSASWVHGWGAKVTLAFDTNGIGGEWVGVDIGTRPPVRREGAFVLDSLDGVLQPFRSWIKSA